MEQIREKEKNRKRAIGSLPKPGIQQSLLSSTDFLLHPNPNVLLPTIFSLSVIKN